MKKLIKNVGEELEEYESCWLGNGEHIIKTPCNKFAFIDVFRGKIVYVKIFQNFNAAEHFAYVMANSCMEA